MYIKNSVVMLVIVCFFVGSFLFAVDVTTNRNAVGMEHNLLFNAVDRYTVTQTGTAALNAQMLFDGKFVPSYTTSAPSQSDPTVITISGLSNANTHEGGWVGWGTRYWPANKFTIEAYDTFGGANQWVILADYSTTAYSGYDYYIKAPLGQYTQLRFTFLEATGPSGELGVSELFFLHPEATTPYDGLLVKADDAFKKSGNNLYYTDGNVGIGIVNPSYKLDVDGIIRAEEVVVETIGADYVFEEGYSLTPLNVVESFIKENNHLPGIPSATEMQEGGVNIGDIATLLLEKVEELTLYVIELEKEDEALRQENVALKQQIEELKNE